MGVSTIHRPRPIINHEVEPDKSSMKSRKYTGEKYKSRRTLYHRTKVLFRKIHTFLLSTLKDTESESYMGNSKDGIR